MNLLLGHKGAGSSRSTQKATPEAAQAQGTRTQEVSVGTPPGVRLLPFVLSVTAGSADVVSFLGFGGLFTAHVTGNLVILAAHIVTGGGAPLAPMLSVPVFIATLSLTRLLAAWLEEAQIASLQPLLALQFALLGGALLVCVTGGSNVAPNDPRAIVAGMLGVCAMAVQNALVQISLKGAPTTAVMTSNFTRFAVDVGTLLFDHDPREATSARNRALRTWPVMVGFVVGCALGAACEAAVGLSALALPAGLAFVAHRLGRSSEHKGSAY